MLARTFTSVLAIAWAGSAQAQTAPVPSVAEPTQSAQRNAEDAALPSPAANPVQGADARRDEGLTDIVVTAQRRATNIQDTPLAISALDSQRIQDTGLRDLEDLSRITPGVSFIPAIANSNFISIRGAVTGLVAPGTDQAASLFLDDVLIVGTSGLDQEIFDLDRVEVLRGPQGTLFGRNVTGGAILLYTKNPQSTFDTRARVTYGSHNRAQGDAYVTGPLSDTVSALLSADYDHYDGDYPNLTRGGRDENRDTFRMKGALRFQPTSDLALQLTGYYSNESRGHASLFNTVGNVKGNPAVASLVTNYQEAGNATITQYNGTNKAIEYMAVGRVDWDTGLGKVTSISAYRQRTLNIANDGAFSSIVAFPSISRNYDRTFSQEVRIATPADKRLSLVAGLYYLNQRSESAANVEATIAPGSYFGTSLVPTGFSPVAAPGCVGPLAPNFFLCNFQTLFKADGTGAANQYSVLNSQNVDTQSYAAFGEATLHITDTLSLIAGGRYTIDRRDGVTSKSPGSGTISNPAVNNLVGLILPTQLYFPPFTVSYQHTWKSFTPKASLTFKATDRVLMYATYSEGFRSGGYSTEGRTAAEAATPLQPENAKNYELGLKSRFLDNRVQVNASGFYVTYYNLQSRAFDNTIQAFVSSNVGDVNVYGVELETLAELTKHLLVGANYAYNDGKVTRDAQGNVPDSAATIVDESRPTLGAKPVGLAKHTVTLFGTYDLPLANDGLVRFNVDATFSGKIYGQRNNADPAFIYNHTTNKGVVNANLSYTTPDHRWELKAFVRNLTNERHIISGSAELSSLLLTSAEIASGTGLFGTIYNPPRTVGASATFSFK